MKRWLVAFGLVALLSVDGWGCGGAVEDCERSDYELARTRFRCTGAAELQTLSCGEWFTLMTCESAGACSPGPDVGCRLNGYDPDWSHLEE